MFVYSDFFITKDIKKSFSCIVKYPMPSLEDYGIHNLVVLANPFCRKNLFWNLWIIFSLQTQLLTNITVDKL